MAIEGWLGGLPPLRNGPNGINAAPERRCDGDLPIVWLIGYATDRRLRVTLMPLEAIVVQHGEKERLPGDPGLTSGGREEAVVTGRWLASCGGAVAVYASPMRRAMETAELIAAQLSLGVGIDSRLRERMNWAAAGDESLASFLADWELATTDREFVPSSGDSSIQAAQRFIDALEDIAVRHRDDHRVVIVSHGGITTDLLRTVLGDAELTRRSPSLIDSGVACCGVTRLARGTNCWHVLAIASTDHLEHAREHRPV